MTAFSLNTTVYFCDFQHLTLLTNLSSQSYNAFKAFFNPYALLSICISSDISVERTECVRAPTDMKSTPSIVESDAIRSIVILR